MTLVSPFQPMASKDAGFPWFWDLVGMLLALGISSFVVLVCFLALVNLVHSRVRVYLLCLGLGAESTCASGRDAISCKVFAVLTKKIDD